MATSTSQSNGNANRHLTARATRGMTTASIGAMMLENSSATPNASATRRHGVRHVTPLNPSSTTIDAATTTAPIRAQ